MQEPPPDFQYDAFLSYAARTDYERARKIETFLEAVHKTLGSKRLPVRQLQVCRDGSDFRLLAKRSNHPEMPEDPIWAVLREELRKSRYLLVLCSPASVTSEWVEAEVSWFIDNRGPEWILPAVTGALDPVNNPEECFPPSLRAVGLHKSRIWYDLRGLGGHGAKSEYKNHEDELVRLAGDLLDWNASRSGPLAAVWEREQRRKARRQKIVAAVVLLVLLVLVGFAVWRSRVATEEAQRAESQRLAARALSLFESDPEQGLRLAVQAVEVSPTDQAENSLRQLLLAFRLLENHSVPDGERVIAVSRDGGMLVTSGPNITSLYTLDTARGMMSERRWVETAGVARASFSPDGKFVALLLPGNEVHVLETLDGRRKGAILNVTSLLAIDSSGDLVVTANDEGMQVRKISSGQVSILLRVPNGTRTNPVVTGGRPLVAAFSTDGNLILTGDDEGFARIWDTQTGALLHTLSGHSSSVLDAEFSDEGSWVVTASQDGTARVWERSGWELRAELKDHTGSVTRATFSNNGMFVVTSSADGTARVWLANTGEPVALLGPHRSPVTQAAFTSNGRRVITASGDGRLRLWDANTGQSLLTLSGHDEQVTGAAFSPNGKLIVTSGRDGTARVWDAGTGSELAKLDADEGICWMARFSPDGEFVATAGADGAVRLWAWRSRKAIKEFNGHQGAVFSVDISPNGQHLLTAGADGVARIWGIVSGNSEVTLSGHTGPVSTATYSPDGTLIITAGWDKVAIVWDAKSGERTIKLEGHRAGLTRASFSPDGKLVATSSLDNTARIWETKTGAILAELPTHSFPVYDAEFSRDGKYVVTTGENGLGIIWEVSTRRPIAALRGHEGFVNSAQFSPDGHYIVTASEDYTVQIYECEICPPLPDLLGLARRRLAAASERQ